MAWTGETYTLSFEVDSTAQRDMIVSVEDSEYNRYLNEKVNINAEKKQYSFDVTFENDMSADLKFQLGNIGDAASVGNHQVTLYNVKFSQK